MNDVCEKIMRLDSKTYAMGTPQKREGQFSQAENVQVD